MFLILGEHSICDLFFRGSAFHQRLKDREIEETADERDRQKEVEQLEVARRKLYEEGDLNAESIIFQMEQKMQEHLRKCLDLTEDRGKLSTDDLANGERNVSVGTIFIK